jgi:hypothetical protein
MHADNPACKHDELKPHDITGGQQAGVQPDAKPAPACSEHPVSNAVASTAMSLGQHLCCVCKEYDGGPGSDFVVWTA